MKHLRLFKLNLHWMLWPALLAVHPGVLPAEHSVPKMTKLTVQSYEPHLGDIPANRLCQQLMREDPALKIVPFSGLGIEGSKGDSRLLSIAGGTGPDVLGSYWHSIRTEIEQNFLCPLNEYVGFDGFYGLNATTNQPDDRTGKPKLKIDPKSNAPVPDINGMIDADEVLWPDWRSFPEIYRYVATAPGVVENGPDGKLYSGACVYGIPNPAWVYWGMVYRRDLFEQVGITENKLPRTWDEFWYCCQKLTNPDKKFAGAKIQYGQRAFAVNPWAWLWLMWLWSNDGSAIMQAKANPATGKEYWFNKEETRFIDPETGESLVAYPSKWQATFGDERGLEALEFYQKLTWQPWIRKKNGEPLDLSPTDVQQGFVQDPQTGAKIQFSSQDVIKGVLRVMVGSGYNDWIDLFRRGEVAVVMASLNDLQVYNLPAANLGFFPVPAGPRGKQIVGSFRHYQTMSARLAGSQNKKIRDKAWHVLSTLCGKEARILSVQDRILKGYSAFLTPDLLIESGYEEYLEVIPEHWRSRYQEVIANARAEPYIGYWYPAEVALATDVISPLLTRENFDLKRVLREVENESNRRRMFGMPEEEKARYRPVGYAFLGVAILIFVVGGILIVRTYSEKASMLTGMIVGSNRGVYQRWAPYLILAPALGSIVLWAYYPLLRGSVMAFQNYRLLGSSHWIGLDNFITVFTDPQFYISIVKTFKFAAMSLAVGFLTPVLLAVLLTEIPKGKILFRTVYLLPQVSSGLVIMFIWKLMYNPTEYGFLNRVIAVLDGLHPGWVLLIKLIFYGLILGITYIFYKLAFRVEHSGKLTKIVFMILFSGMVLAFFIFPVYEFISKIFRTDFVSAVQNTFWSPTGIGPQRWLQDTNLAMLSVILPGVWAGAGIGSLIYLAALKSVDEESYEAAEIDGANFLEKAWYITIPYLKPLILINFIGSFINVFRDMGNIFVLTGGGPEGETTVLSLKIWYSAFAFLRFGEATVMAWFLGIMLISFTIYQLRILKKVEFRRAEAN